MSFKEGDKVRIREFEAYIVSRHPCSDGTFDLSLSKELPVGGIYVPEQYLEKVISYEEEGLYEADSGSVYRYIGGERFVNLITGNVSYRSEIEELHHMVRED